MLGAAGVDQPEIFGCCASGLETAARYCLGAEANSSVVQPLQQDPGVDGEIDGTVWRMKVWM